MLQIVPCITIIVPPNFSVVNVVVGGANVRSIRPDGVLVIVTEFHRMEEF